MTPRRVATHSLRKNVLGNRVINLRTMRLAEAHMEKTADAYKFLVRISEWKKPLGRSKRK